MQKILCYLISKQSKKILAKPLHLGDASVAQSMHFFKGTLITIYRS